MTTNQEFFLYVQGYTRYEKVRKLNPNEFSKIWRVNLQGLHTFDELVDMWPSLPEIKMNNAKKRIEELIKNYSRHLKPSRGNDMQSNEYNEGYSEGEKSIAYAIIDDLNILLKIINEDISN